MKKIKLEKADKFIKNMENLSSKFKFEMSESHVSPFVKIIKKNLENTHELPNKYFLKSKQDKL
tara:strand:- start:3770 stop:3958 length:189 start_codon:yes stop_codon:yes gene_type:complete